MVPLTGYFCKMVPGEANNLIVIRTFNLAFYGSYMVCILVKYTHLIFSNVLCINAEFDYSFLSVVAVIVTCIKLFYNLSSSVEYS